MRRTILAAALLAALLTACGGGATTATPVAVVQEADPGAYDGVIAAIARARIPVTTCPVQGGGAYEPIVQPTGKVSQGPVYLQYTDGRAYELGPCETLPDKRTILRMYHFPDEQTRDAAVDAAGEHGIRATSSWKYREAFTVEIWMTNPDDTGPVGQVASAAHLAIGAVPEMRHVQVGNNR